MVVGFHHQHMGGVPLSVQGPRASHQEPAADVDPEVVAMVTCVEEHMRCMGWTGRRMSVRWRTVGSRPYRRLVLPTGCGNLTEAHKIP